MTQWMNMYDAGSQQPDTMLGPYRVLDLADEKGLICSKALGDLGADVIQIEPPGGSSARNLGPFCRDIPSAEESLHWFAYSANKRSITLNLEASDGQDMFKKLAAKVHTRDHGVPVLFGKDAFDDKLDRLERIYAELKPRLTALHYIDLNVADRVIVKVDPKYAAGRNEKQGRKGMS